jgi:hypothetical protein
VHVPQLKSPRFSYEAWQSQLRMVYLLELQLLDYFYELNDEFVNVDFALSQDAILIFDPMTIVSVGDFVILNLLTIFNNKGLVKIRA